MATDETVRWLIWIIPLVLIFILIVIDLLLFLHYRAQQATIPAITNLQASYVSSDLSTKTQTWTLTWDELTPGASYTYYMSKIQNYAGEIRLAPLPIGLSGTIQNKTLTFDNLPSSSMYEISIYATLGDLQSVPIVLTWASKIEDGDIFYLFAGIQGMAGVDHETGEVFADFATDPYPGYTAFVARRAVADQDIFAFYSTSTTLLNVDPTTFIISLGTDTSNASQFAVTYTDGGLSLTSVLTNQFVSFVGIPDNEQRPTALANVDTSQIFTISSTLYFANGQPTFLGAGASGLFMQFLFELFVDGSNLFIIGVENPNPLSVTDASFTFYPFFQTDDTWKFQIGAHEIANNAEQVFVSNTQPSEIGGLCDTAAVDSLVVGRLESDLPTSAEWDLLPINATIFYLVNSPLQHYMKFCTGCCTGTGLPANFMDTSLSTAAPQSVIFAELGTI